MRTYMASMYHDDRLPLIPAIRQQYDCLNTTSNSLTSLISLITDIERGRGLWSKGNRFQEGDARYKSPNEVSREMSLTDNDESITKNSCRFQSSRTGIVLGLLATTVFTIVLSFHIIAFDASMY